MSDSNPSKIVNMPNAEDELLAAVRAEMDIGNLTQAAAARAIGVSSATLNRRLKGLYNGNVPAVDAKLNVWLTARRERRQVSAAMPDAPDWVATPSARRIRAALGYAQAAGDIAVVYGGAGVGKTSTARAYRDMSPNVWISTMTPASSTVGAALERIAHAVGVSASGRASRIETDLVERLMGTQGLLVIDEAQHLTARALEAVRSLADATGVGVAILGNEVVYTQLTGGRRSIGFAQLFSRIGKRVALRRPTKEDVDVLASAWAVEGNQSRSLLREIARKPGALRAVTKVMRMASMFAAGDDAQAPTLQHIQAAWVDLGGQ